jgi:uncharacterized protein YjiS (DUF1127 family)
MSISVIDFYDWNYITGQTTLNCIIQRKEMPYDSAANLAGTQTLAVWTTIKWLLHHYKEHRRRQRAIAELESVDPRILKDIGIDRTEATSIVYGNPRGRRRRYADVESPFEGRRWSDTTERELIRGITNYPSSRF